MRSQGLNGLMAEGHGFEALKYIVKIFPILPQNHLAQMLEIWHVALPTCFYQVCSNEDQGSKWLCPRWFFG